MHFRTLEDLSADQLTHVLDRADELARLRGTDEHPTPLRNKSIVVLLEKASTRTRVSFEVGIAELGGTAVPLIAKHTQLGRGEPLSDTARMLAGYAHGVVYRTFGHERVEALAEHATIPIINGLSDGYHPCQLLADLQTVRAHRPLEGCVVAWIGDGNNMAHSWILAAARTGLRLRVASPEGFTCDPAIVERGRALGAEVVLTHDPVEATHGAHVVTTDVWASMGQEEEAAQRQAAFADFQVDATLMGHATEDAIFLHCLPAHRGEEVAAEVIDGRWSRVWQEAENRLHAQKALLELLCGGDA